MWMCARCQAINDGEANGAVCPKCGATAPEPTIPPHARVLGSASAPSATEQNSTLSSAPAGSTSSSPMAETSASPPVESIATHDLDKPPLGISSSTPDRPSVILPASNGDATPFAVDEPEEVEISEEEYEKLTAQAQLMRSPIVVVALILVAIVGIGTALYERGANSDNSDSIMAPSMIMTRMMAHRHGGAPNVSGTWIGTDHTLASLLPVTYTFGPNADLTVTGPADASGAGTPQTAEGTYALKGNTLTVSNLKLNGTPVDPTQPSIWPAVPKLAMTVTNDGLSLILKQADGTLFLKRPQAVVGNWSGSIPLGSGTISVKMILQPSGAGQIMGRDAAGKQFMLIGNYALVSGSMILRTQVQPGSAVAFPLAAMMTFDGDNLLLVPTGTPSQPLRFTKQ